MRITIEISKEDYEFIKRIPKTYLLDDYLNVRLYAAIKEGKIEKKAGQTDKTETSLKRV